MIRKITALIIEFLVLCFWIHEWVWEKLKNLNSLKNSKERVALNGEM